MVAILDRLRLERSGLESWPGSFTRDVDFCFTEYNMPCFLAKSLLKIACLLLCHR